MYQNPCDEDLSIGIPLHEVARDTSQVQFLDFGVVYVESPIDSRVEILVRLVESALDVGTRESGLDDATNHHPINFPSQNCSLEYRTPRLEHSVGSQAIDDHVFHHRRFDGRSSNRTLKELDVL